MHTRREAILWESIGTGKLRCELCPHRCLLSEGDWGLCRVRTVEGGRLLTTVYGALVALHDDPVEKKPLFHFLPGSRTLSLATRGCNLRCRFCQNAPISQASPERLREDFVPPERVVSLARERGCRSVSFTYTEPTVFLEYVLDTARPARAAGLETVLVTNGYLSAEALALVAPLTSAANVDLKCFTERGYREVTGGRLAPVLDTLRGMKAAGLWLEVTTLVVPGFNDSPEELRAIAEFLAGELGLETPWHVSRFHPNFEMQDRGPTPVESLRRALTAGREAGLRHVYAGNLPGDDSEHTRCAGCGALLLERHGHRLLSSRLEEGEAVADWRPPGPPASSRQIWERRLPAGSTGPRRAEGPHVQWLQDPTSSRPGGARSAADAGRMPALPVGRANATASGTCPSCGAALAGRFA